MAAAALACRCVPDRLLPLANCSRAARLPLLPYAAAAPNRRTLQDMVFATFTSPEHYFLQIDPEAQGASGSEGER